MARHARKGRGRRVRANETGGSVEAAIVDDNSGIVLGRTVIINLPEDASRRIDWPRGGGGVSLSTPDERRTIGRLVSERKTVIRRICPRGTHDVGHVN